MLATSKNDAQVIVKLSSYQYRWLEEPGNRTLLEVTLMVVTWWIVAFVQWVFLAMSQLL